MGIWPTIPIIILFPSVIEPSNEEHVITALEHNDRVSCINLYVSEAQLGKIARLMLEPFPMLTHLSITSGNLSALPDGFLGGSAPSLQKLDLPGALYQASPKLLLSASNLVNLRLHKITVPTGYVSPEALVTHLATLLRLEIIDIGFTSFLDPISSPLKTRTVLPTLRNFSYSGRCKYLEDFISRIDTPQINSIVIYYESGDSFDIPQLSKFINRSESLKRSLSRQCKISLSDCDEDFVTFCISRTTSERWDPKPGILVGLSDYIEEQILHLTNILGFMSPMLSHVVHCTIDSVLAILCPVHQSEPTWLQVLRQISSMQTLFVFETSTSIIYDSLIYLNGEMITQVLPALKLLYLEGQPMPSLRGFLAARRESSHPVTIIQTKEEFEEKLKYYL